MLCVCVCVWGGGGGGGGGGGRTQVQLWFNLCMGYVYVCGGRGGGGGQMSLVLSLPHLAMMREAMVSVPRKFTR